MTDEMMPTDEIGEKAKIVMTPEMMANRWVTREPSKLKIKTHSSILAKIHDAIGRGQVVKHAPTSSNQLGQSGYHTVTDDLMNIIEEATGDKFTAAHAGQVYRGIAGFLQSLGEFQQKDTQDFCPKCLYVGGKCRCD